jgi:HEAT repeat protein
MATMLCQLYTDTPDRPLPKSRGQIYQQFLELLDKRQRSAGLRDQTRAALEECGDEALAAAEKTLKHLQDLIARLAAERHAGNIAPALDILATQPEAARPKRVPEPEWRTFLDESLRSSGLLTVEAGEAVFLHQTLLEYLAARHATHDAAAQARTYKALDRPFRYGWSRTYLPDFRSPVWGRRYWAPPREDSDSFVGFLIDIGYAEPTESTLALDRFLNRLASRGGLDGCEFIVRQAQLGTRLPKPITRTAVDSLAELSRDPAVFSYFRRRAATALAALDHQRASDLLDFLARDPAANSNDRISAAIELAELGDHRAADLLVFFAHDPGLYGSQRLAVAVTLAEFDQRRAADLIALLAHDPDLDSGVRVDVAKALDRLGDHRAADAFAVFARDPDEYSGDRVRAATALAALDHQRASDLLDFLARDRDAYSEDRVDAAIKLAELGDHRAAGLLAFLAHDRELDSDDRVRAATALAELGH